jgi:glycosyltransferase involved in cell wall biosynthesis
MRYQVAAKIVANSQWVAECVVASGILSEKLTVVHEGTEIPPRFTMKQKQCAREHWGVPEGTTLLGCVGVLLPDKGQEWLIRALAELRKEFPNVKLLLAGDGREREKLQNLAHELGVSDAVIFAGFVKDVESVYAALDVFLLPSFFEALNNSLLAAMVYEIPSIAFNRGALREIIEHGKSGLLVEAANTSALRDAIASFLREPAFARQLGAAGRERVQENFSAAKMVDGMIRVYEEVLHAV